jgi:hypothetical protein
VAAGHRGGAAAAGAGAGAPAGGAGGSGGSDAAIAAAANPALALADLDRALAELSGSPVELSILYNGYAQPYGMWDICLQMIHFAGGGGGGGAAEPSAVVRTLWDHELLRVGGAGHGFVPSYGFRAWRYVAACSDLNPAAHLFHEATCMTAKAGHIVLY